MLLDPSFEGSLGLIDVDLTTSARYVLRKLRSLVSRLGEGL